jgi:hypothetical protein
VVDLHEQCGRPPRRRPLELVVRDEIVAPRRRPLADEVSNRAGLDRRVEGDRRQGEQRERVEPEVRAEQAVRVLAPPGRPDDLEAGGELPQPLAVDACQPYRLVVLRKEVVLVVAYGRLRGGD